MKGTHHGWLALTALAALTLSGGRLSADDLYNKKTFKGDSVALPKPSEVASLSVQPTQVSLKGLDDSAQLIITGNLAARLQDLSGDVKYHVADGKVARVTSA